MAFKRILVLGNGDIARSIISALSTVLSEEGDPAYKIAVLTSPHQTPYLPAHVAAESVEHKTSDFASASLEEAFAEQDVVISTMGGGNYDLQRSIVDAAVGAHVTRFIPHEFGQATLNTKVQQRTRHGSERAKLIDLLKDRQSTLEWVAVAVGCILDPLLLSGDLGFDLAWQSASINGSGNEIFAASSLERVGIVMKGIIQHWDEIKNQYLYVAGVQTSANELVNSLEQASKSKWSVGYSDVQDCVREGKSRIERGFLDSGMFLLERSVLYDKSLGAAEPFQQHDASRIFELEAEHTDDIASRVYHNFEHYGKVSCGC